jgi:hypothetical protein
VRCPVDCGLCVVGGASLIDLRSFDAFDCKHVLSTWKPTWHVNLRCPVDCGLGVVGNRFWIDLRRFDAPDCKDSSACMSDPHFVLCIIAVAACNPSCNLKCRSFQELEQSKQRLRSKGIRLYYTRAELLFGGGAGTGSASRRDDAKAE